MNDIIEMIAEARDDYRRGEFSISEVLGFLIAIVGPCYFLF